MPLLENKVAVVLGASSGIGWATAERFASEGAKVVVSARRLENLERLAAQIDGLAVRCDGSDFDQVQALAEAAVDRYGRIDIAVNSAGLNVPSPIRSVTPEVIRVILGGWRRSRFRSINSHFPQNLCCLRSVFWPFAWCNDLTNHRAGVWCGYVRKVCSILFQP